MLLMLSLSGFFKNSPWSYWEIRQSLWVCNMLSTWVFSNIIYYYFLHTVNMTFIVWWNFRYYLARKPIVVIADPDILRQVMVRDFTSFPNRIVRTLNRACTCLTQCDHSCIWHAFLCSLPVLSPSPWLTACSFWEMIDGRECAASWPHHLAPPKWRR